jgi:hypothetical protein
MIDVFAVQDEIARAVGNSLRVALAPSAPALAPSAGLCVEADAEVLASAFCVLLMALVTALDLVDGSVADACASSPGWFPAPKGADGSWEVVMPGHVLE